jgi:sugar porter (SP) family MFS transporter
MENRKSIVLISLIVALGGFLMGFDASVISGVVKFIEPEFQLSKIQIGWAVSSLTLTATLAMMFSGPLSNRFGRKKLLSYAALLYTLSAILSALAPNFTALVIARMIGGFGVGMSLILAPMYIAELSPPKIRGRMVSFNQLNIVIGISVAFFTNYLILKLGQSDAAWTKSIKLEENIWRWMLGVETLPAILYFFVLYLVPRSPRWLIMKGRYDEALKVLKSTRSDENAVNELEEVKKSILSDTRSAKTPIKELFMPGLKLVLTIGVVIAILQQITGINSVFFYAPMIFEQSGIGTDASFSQAIYVGLTNLIFTIVAISLIDRLGRKPLLSIGVSAIAIFMFLLSYGFSSAEYKLTSEAILQLPEEINKEQLYQIKDLPFDSDIAFKDAMKKTVGPEIFKKYESEFIKRSIHVNSVLILIGILGFVAAFAVSIGPVMWVMFSELFPNRVRGLAISFVGLINSAISFSVQLVFPWELSTIGNGGTFLIYGVFALIGVGFIIYKVPETKGKSLEELEKILTKH